MNPEIEAQLERELRGKKPDAPPEMADAPPKDEDPSGLDLPPTR